METRTAVIAVGTGLALGVGAVLMSVRRASARSAGDAMLLGATQTSAPTGYRPTSDVLQSRPVPDPETLSDSQKADVTAVAQRQLNALGYGPLVADGIVGPRTNGAAETFARAERGRLASYLLAGLTRDRAALEAIDDKYRENNGLARATDYAAPTSNGLTGPARHRGRV